MMLMLPDNVNTRMLIANRRPPVLSFAILLTQLQQQDLSTNNPEKF